MTQQTQRTHQALTQPLSCHHCLRSCHGFFLLNTTRFLFDRLSFDDHKGNITNNTDTLLDVMVLHATTGLSRQQNVSLMTYSKANFTAAGVDRCLFVNIVQKNIGTYFHKSGAINTITTITTTSPTNTTTTPTLLLYLHIAISMAVPITVINFLSDLLSSYTRKK